jgi:hypothetical protein
VTIEYKLVRSIRVFINEMDTKRNHMYFGQSLWDVTIRTTDRTSFEIEQLTKDELSEIQNAVRDGRTLRIDIYTEQPEE